MPNVPSDLDPDLFILADGVYDNLRVAKAINTDSEFRIEPAPTPWGYVALCNVALCGFAYGIHWVVKNHSDDPTNKLLLYALPIGFSVVICTILTAIILYRFKSEQNRGTWLVYDKRTRQISLPRHGKQFDFSEVKHLQYTSTRDHKEQRLSKNDIVSELNLVTQRDGAVERWHLVSSGFGFNAFEYLLRPLAQHTDIPVVRIQQQLFGWGVTVKPFE